MIIFNEDFTVSLLLETVEIMDVSSHLSFFKCDLNDKGEEKYVLDFDNQHMAQGSKQDLSLRMMELRILQNQLKLHKETSKIHNAMYAVVSSKEIKLLTKEQLDSELNCQGIIKNTFEKFNEDTNGDINWLYC